MDLNAYYRALIDYRKITAENREIAKLRKFAAEANADKDIIEIVRTNCIIEEDWIEAIEKGLIHVEKAINEERQFIRSNGEILPIEKVKQVSKDSVEHLARHSNLLTKKPEGRDIIPDKLYTVERLSDYAVYENRFLYMMLCFLRDFIAFRYDKIIELTNTYSGKLKMRKQVSARDRKIVYEIKLDEQIKNDEYLKEHNPVKDKIDRIDLIYKTVIAFLNTPLMEFVSKAPMLKPPITETNVLKMNKNFKGAKELYYFISSYDKPGYTVEQSVHKLNPFNEDVADEFAEVIALNSFLTYEHGLGLEKQLKAEYDREEKLNKEYEQQKRSEQIKSLKKKIKQSGASVEEYMLLLEQRNKYLENDSAQLAVLKTEFKKLEEEHGELKGCVDGLKTTVNEQKNELENIAQVHKEQLDRQTEEHETKLKEITESHETQIREMNEKHVEEVKFLNEAQEQKVKEYNAEIDRVAEEYNAKLAEQKEECEQRVVKAEKEKLVKDDEIVELKRAMDKLAAEKLLVEARLNSLLHENGMFSTEDDFTTRESFDEIEKQYKAFKDFFKGEWKSAKKKIRREMLNSENIKNISERKYVFEPTQTEIDFEPILGPTKPSKITEKENAEETAPEKQDSAEVEKKIDKDEK